MGTNVAKLVCIDLTCQECCFGRMCQVKVKVTQSCLTLCDPVDYTVHGILQARILEDIPLLQGIFPTQGSNLGLLHCMRILYQLSHKGILNTGQPRASINPANQLNESKESLYVLLTVEVLANDTHFLKVITLE